MKIATTTCDFAHYFTEDIDRVKEVHDAGFNYVDLDMYSFTPDSPYMKDDWKDAVKKLKDYADSIGVKFVQAHSQGGNPMSKDKDEADFIVKATIRSIEICKELGIKNTVAHPGSGMGLLKDDWFIENRKFYSKLFPAMEDCDVNVLIENSTSFITKKYYYANTGKDMAEFLKFVGHEKLHACWDTGHGNCEGGQYDQILALGKEIYAIHYNDNHGEKDEHLIPYLGTLNHDEIINALLDIGYKGYFTLECSSTLIKNEFWLGDRRVFEKEKRLIHPQPFMQRRISQLSYEIAKYILETYGLFEE